MNTLRFPSAESPSARGVLMLCALLALCACDSTQKKKPATQVAAKVNGEEISIHQINAVLSRVPGANVTSPEALRQEVLDKLIDQQVLYAEATARKLDRDPKVMMLVDSARREIIARAYLDSLLAGMSKVTSSDVHRYYAENPALFAKRKIYKLDEISMPARPDLRDTLTQMIDDGESLPAIGKYLTAQGVEFKSGNGVRSAEQIPLEVLPRLAAAQEGEVLLMDGDSDNRYQILRVLSVQSAPVSEIQARPHIEAFLGNLRSQQLTAQEIKRLKTNARIEYLGNFSRTTSAEAKPAVAAIKSERMIP